MKEGRWLFKQHEGVISNYSNLREKGGTHLVKASTAKNFFMIRYDAEYGVMEASANYDGHIHEYKIPDNFQEIHELEFEIEDVLKQQLKEKEQAQ